MDQMWIPINLSWRLNERHYGALQGLNKLETALEYGEEQVQLWRRSYSIRPPALTPEMIVTLGSTRVIMTCLPRTSH